MRVGPPTCTPRKFPVVAGVSVAALLNQPMKIFALLLVFLVLQGGLRFDRRIRQTIQITQLESLCTVQIILQGRL